tara:strand:+ start:58 stop:249 length:192 start_codon:yes stop_codon:yes gene_type:complete
MGFNKRYLNEKSIRQVYGDGGYEKLEVFIRKPDALIVEDEFSQKIVDLIIEGDSELRIKTLIN